MKTNTTPIVNAIEQINLSGNMIPSSWYQEIKTDTGKTALLAINILADILYWYKPTIVRDETTGSVISKTKKFKSDKLQKKYKHYADFFGFPKDTVTDAIDLLVARGLITREFRTVHTGIMVLNNVMFLEPVPAKIIEITFRNLDPIGESPTSPMGENPDTLPEENTDTNTEITTETKKNISSLSEKKPKSSKTNVSGKTSQLRPPSPSSLILQALEKHYHLTLDMTWTSTRAFLKWAVEKAYMTPAQIEYSTAWWKDQDWCEKGPNEVLIQKNWLKSIEGYREPSQQSQPARQMTREDMIDLGGV